MAEILIVDDLQMFREPVADALRQRGYTVTVAGDGRQCLDAVQRRVPDLVLLDVSMPVLGGVDTLLALRSEPRSSHLPVIMLTDAAERDMILKAGKLGISGYVLKSSFSLKTLLGRIDDSLDGREMEVELDRLGVIEAPRSLGGAA